MKFFSKKNDKAKKWLSLILLSGLAIKYYYGLKKKKKLKAIENNFKKFLKNEKREVYELEHGQESIWKFFCDSGSILKDYFIPHDGNNHKPKILRSKSLAIMAIALLILKASVTGYLFFIYPDRAFMAGEMADQILNLTNQSRIADNLEPLTVNPALNASALAKANDMLNNNYFAHISPSGVKPWDWINKSEYSYLYVGENLGMNFSSADSVHSALMLSPAHKKNILNINYKDIGLAVLSGEIDGQPTNILVELFGSEKTEAKITEIKLWPVKEEISPEKTTASAPLTATSTSVLASENIPLKNNVITPLAAKEISSSTAVAAAPINAEPLSTIQTNPSPNDEIINNLPPQISQIKVASPGKINLADKLIKMANYTNYSVLLLLIFSLLINIFVKIKIQHKPVIIQSFILIIFIISLIYLHLHLLENIDNLVTVI